MFNYAAFLLSTLLRRLAFLTHLAFCESLREPLNLIILMFFLGLEAGALPIVRTGSEGRHDSPCFCTS